MDKKMVRGWRGRLDDAISEAKQAIWSAPSSTNYSECQSPAPKHENFHAHKKWFTLAYDGRREEARLQLQHLLQEKRSRDQPTEKPAADPTLDRLARRRQWYADQTDTWRARESEKAKQRRANFDEERRALEAAAKKRRRLAKPEVYREIEARAYAKNKDAKNARRRAAYAANPEKFRARTRTYRSRTAIHKEMKPST